MDRNRAAVILEVAILHEMVLNWTDCKRLEAGIRWGLDEIVRRQQEDGPEIVGMPPVRQHQGAKEKNHISIIF